ncbi:hypothetical protein ACJX0J_026801 [Zea mays]
MANHQFLIFIKHLIFGGVLPQKLFWSPNNIYRFSIMIHLILFSSLPGLVTKITFTSISIYLFVDIVVLLRLFFNTGTKVLSLSLEIEILYIYLGTPAGEYVAINKVQAAVEGDVSLMKNGVRHIIFFVFENFIFIKKTKAI